MPKTNSLIASKLEKVRTQLPYLPRALNLVWTAARGWTVAWITLLVIQGVLPVAIVTLTKVLVDSLVAAVDAGGAWDAVRGPLLLALIMAGLLLITELLRAPTRFVPTAGGGSRRAFPSTGFDSDGTFRLMPQVPSSGLLMPQTAPHGVIKSCRSAQSRIHRRQSALPIGDRVRK